MQCIDRSKPKTPGVLLVVSLYAGCTVLSFKLPQHRLQAESDSQTAKHARCLQIATPVQVPQEGGTFFTFFGNGRCGSGGATGEGVFILHFLSANQSWARHRHLYSSSYQDNLDNRDLLVCESLSVALRQYGRPMRLQFGTRGFVDFLLFFLYSIFLKNIYLFCLFLLLFLLPSIPLPPFFFGKRILNVFL